LNVDMALLLLYRLEVPAATGAAVIAGGRVGVEEVAAALDDALDIAGAAELATDGADDATVAATEPRSQGFGGEPMDARA